VGALEIRPKAPDSFVRAVSSSQVFEAAVVVKADDHWGGGTLCLYVFKRRRRRNHRTGHHRSLSCQYGAL